MQDLSSQEVPRFRLGIESRGELTPAQQDTASFVLERFRNEERFQVKEMLEQCAEAVVLALKKGLEAAQDKFSS